MQIVSVVGKKNSGKTSLTIKLIEALRKRGYKVATIKHSHHTMEMDKENTDTWRHKQAGSQLVVGIGSTTFFNVQNILDLDRLLFLIEVMDDVDFVVIEGFKNYNYPKIATSPNVVDEYTITEVNSFEITPEEIEELIDLIEQKGYGIVNTLYNDECGYNDGDSIAKEIIKGNVSLDELDSVDVALSVDGKVVGLNEFVSDFIKQTFLGMLKTLNIENFGAKDLNKVELLIRNTNHGDD
ncbi:MAG: molybdopterin-guanine dinucleotide biosynthesis protein B [Methanobrevibacter sp.]|uniref:molybdopterin-guanine dinucleotide biosynthesis protein B n=1 Tax=Methanobrevibacter sp. TaxID=66852 RepID=UPI0026DFF0FA|nr:molybdopterin-guanine dinucleotide biosynthesis protein B [Methanobrevibacter sp.]MDO5848572.1 molybdopterin-guanine dinucleotide biosynthesis protein B [Methanobrevibacter sp.]